MTPLVEVHREEELERALGCGAQVIGINNRNLETMVVDIKTVERLSVLLPEGTTVVAESGIRSREDMEFLAGLKVDAALVGESIVSADDAGEKIRSLLGKDK